MILRKQLCVPAALRVPREHHSLPCRLFLLEELSPTLVRAVGRQPLDQLDQPVLDAVGAVHRDARVEVASLDDFATKLFEGFFILVVLADRGRHVVRVRQVDDVIAERRSRAAEFVLVGRRGPGAGQEDQQLAARRHGGVEENPVRRIGLPDGGIRLVREDGDDVEAGHQGEQCGESHVNTLAPRREATSDNLPSKGDVQGKAFVTPVMMNCTASAASMTPDSRLTTLPPVTPITRITSGVRRISR